MLKKCIFWEGGGLGFTYLNIYSFKCTLLMSSANAYSCVTATNHNHDLEHDFHPKRFPSAPL